MTELLTPEEEKERHARIEHLIAHAILALTDTQKREQDIRYAPWLLLATGAGASAALIGAIVAVLKWLQH